MSIRKNMFLAVATFALAFTMAGTANAQTGSWSAPSGAPPTVNVLAPLNIGPASQTKTGLLRVNGGFYSQGVSIFENRVEIGVDPCYGVGPGGCTMTGGDGAAGASAEPARVASGNLIQRLAAMVMPRSAMATGTPSTDKLHVYGNSSFIGDLTVNGHDVCLENGTNCGASSGQWITSGTNIYRNTGKVGVGLTAAPLGKMEIRDTNAQLVLGQTDANRWKLWAGGNLHFRKADDTDVFFLGSDGKVGVGTTSPTARFNVNGDTVIGGAATGGKTITFTPSNNAGVELGSNTGTTPAGTTPFIDFHFGGTSQDYNSRMINDADGQLSFQNAGGTKMKVVNTSQSVIVTNAQPVYLVTSGSCNAAGPAANSASMIYLGSGTLQRGTLSTYKYCEVAGSYPEQQLVGYLLPPPPTPPTSSSTSTVFSVGSIGVATGTGSGSTRERQISIGIWGDTPASFTSKSLVVQNASGGATIYSGSLDNGAGAAYKYVTMGCSSSGTLKFNITATLVHPTYGTTTRTLLYVSNC